MNIFSRLAHNLRKGGLTQAQEDGHRKPEAEGASLVRTSQAKELVRASLAKMVTADQPTPLAPKGHNYAGIEFEYKGTLDEVRTYLEQHGCNLLRGLWGWARGVGKEFVPARDYVAYCDVRQGYKVSHGDSYITFEYWAITRLRRTVYGCKSGVFEALD